MAKDFIWVAYFDYCDGDICCDQIEVLSRTEKQMRLATSCKGTSHRTRVRPDFGYATKREALAALLELRRSARENLAETIIEYDSSIVALEKMIDKEPANA